MIFPTSLSPKTILILVCAMAFAVASSGSEPALSPNTRERPRRSYTAVRLTGTPPIIDGRLDDDCWKNLGEWAGDYTQREPHEGGKGSLPTEIKVLYDSRYLYVAIRAHDSTVGTRPRLMGARDEFTGDIVGINFDSYGNHQAGFEFDVTSGGSKIDLILHNDGSIDLSWNAVWEVKTAMEKDAWTAEYRIPLSQLRYHSGARQVWGMHSWRWIAALQEESDWNLIPMDHHGMLYSFGELHGLDGLPVSRRFELVPYVIAKDHFYPSEPGNPFRQGGSHSSIDGGLDAKGGIGTNLTLDLTVNPDFSQVDADPSEINLSTVETFLTERRTFFLEGKDIFDFKLDDDYVFYTRRIGDAPSLSPPTEGYHDSPESNRILGAAKLTGRTQSGLTVGVLQAMVDRSSTQVFDASGYRSVTTEPFTNDTAVRLTQDFNGGNTQVGMIGTASFRSGSDLELQTLARRNVTVGADAFHYLDQRNYLIEGRFLASSVTGSAEAITALMTNPTHNYQRVDADNVLDPTAHSLTGHAGFLRAGRVAGLWRYNGFVSWRSPGVDFNELGYMQVADFVTPGAQVQYYNAEAGSWLRRRDIRLRVNAPRDFAGEQLGRNVYLESEFATLGGCYLWARLGAETSNLDTHVLRGGPALREANRYPLDFYAETDGGKAWQYRYSGGCYISDDGRGLYVVSKPGIVWKRGDRWKTSLTVEYDRNRQATQYAGSASGAPAPQYLMGNLDQNVFATTLQITVNFSPSLSLAYYGGPFVTSGRYSNFKLVTHPRETQARDRFAPLAMQSSGDGTLSGIYLGDDLRMANPDFDWREFKSNLVLRWEYRAGSSLYCVWSQYRSDAAALGGFAPLTQYDRLFSARPDNTLLLKFSYWLSI